MSGIAGWISSHQNVDDAKKVLSAMAAEITHDRDDRNADIIHGRCAMTGAQKSQRLHLVQNAEDTILVAGAPYTTDPKLSASFKESGIASTILHELKTTGYSVFSKLLGTFTLAAAIPSANKAYLAVDRIARMPLSFSHQNGHLVFGSFAGAINCHPEIQYDIDTQALFDFLYFAFIASPESIFRQHRQLRPGHCVELVGNELREHEYWRVQYHNEHGDQNVSDYKDQLFELVSKAVKQETTDGNVGAFLSGGTDSSTVVGMLGKVTGEQPHCFSIGFDQQGYDEMEYARITAKHFNGQHHEYYVTPEDIVQAIPLLAKTYSLPFGNSSAVPAFYCAQMAKEAGFSKLLAGDGGDELFAGNQRYAKQKIFALYENIPVFLRKGLIEPATDHVPGIWSVPGFSKVKSYVDQARAPMPGRMEGYNLLARIGIDKIFTPLFIEQINSQHASQQVADYYNCSSAQTMMNAMLDMDLKFTLADNDLVKVGNTCDAAGMEVAYPLLSDELVEFAAGIPVELKLKGQYLRYFYKQAMKGFLPEQVISKKKQGFGLPIGHWILSHKPLNQLAQIALEELVNEKLINENFSKTLMQELLPAHPGYYGTMVWLLLMLQQWKKEHCPNIPLIGG